MRAQVIFINGTSSSGKTTVARALQAFLSEPFLLASIDDFIAMHPDRTRLGDLVKRPSGGLHIRLSPEGRRLHRGFHAAVAALVGSGHRVIVDDLLLDRQVVEDWIDALAWARVLLVGLQCSIPEAERREGSRADRTRGLARGFVLTAHEHISYDVEVDTEAMSPEECAAYIAACWDRSRPPSAMRSLPWPAQRHDVGVHC